MKKSWFGYVERMDEVELQIKPKIFELWLSKMIKNKRSLKKVGA